MAEKDFLDRVRQYARLRGWEHVYHSWASIHSPRGFPDLFMIRDGRALAIELKSGKNQPTEPQADWIDALNAVPGITAFVAWECDEERIRALLDGVETLG